MDNPIYATPAMAIGKHDWRCIVFNHPQHGRCTHYQWRELGAERWRSHRDWPGYDFNNGATLGLPSRLSKLHSAYKEKIDAAVSGVTPVPRQAQLFASL